MLCKRIIPCLDIANGKVVKGINFENLRDAGDPVEVAERYNQEGADELCFLDITATVENRATLLGVVEQVAKKIFIPLTVGGGIQSLAAVQDLLNAGADKVSINSAAVKNPQLINDIAERFGSQCVVVAMDVRQTPVSVPLSETATSAQARHWWQVYVAGGRTPTGLDCLAWAQEVTRRGAGEILLTSMDKDGTKSGFDLAITRQVSELLPIPVIASGGVGSLQHLYEGLTEGKAEAVLAASIFHFREYTIAQCKTYLQSHGVAVRF